MSLTISKLNKSYLQSSLRLEILKGLSLQVETGKVVAILGQSGSGKSTLLSLLAGLDRPDSGKIMVGDQDITLLNQNELTKFRGKRIGIIFQQFHLIPHLTALENVETPLEIAGEKNILERAQKILSEVGLKDRIHHYPSQLSGGECQRVAIARALVINPEILLADEPSGNLDTATGQQVMDVLFNVVRSNHTTTLLVTHNNEVAQRCDQQFVLKNGVL